VIDSRIFAFLFACASILLSMASTAMAQSDDGQIEEIQVTATRRDASQ
jgi:hypothetical protein